jgi:hypothetical protein
MVPTKYGDDTIERICEQLAEGKSLITICRQEGMPDRSTVKRWMASDDEISGRLLEARESGFEVRAEMAVAAAKNARDPIAGRLAFDAERWYLGKLSNAFREKPIAVGIGVNVDASDAFATFAGALEAAREARASLAERTCAVVVDGTSRSVDPGRELLDLAGAGGKGLGEDPDRG